MSFRTPRIGSSLIQNLGLQSVIDRKKKDAELKARQIALEGRLDEARIKRQARGQRGIFETAGTILGATGGFIFGGGTPGATVGAKLGQTVGGVISGKAPSKRASIASEGIQTGLALVGKFEEKKTAKIEALDKEDRALISDIQKQGRPIFTTIKEAMRHGDNKKNIVKIKLNSDKDFFTTKKTDKADSKTFKGGLTSKDYTSLVNKVFAESASGTIDDAILEVNNAIDRNLGPKGQTKTKFKKEEKKIIENPVNPLTVKAIKSLAGFKSKQKALQSFKNTKEEMKKLGIDIKAVKKALNDRFNVNIIDKAKFLF